MTARSLRSWPTWTVAELSVLDLAAAVALSAAGFALIAKHAHHTHATVWAAVGLAAMIMPVAARRRWPLAAVGSMAVATLLNGLIFGPLVRCGVALPAAFLLAFAVGSRRDRTWSTVGLAICTAGVVVEGLYDPQIEVQGLVFILPLLAAFFAAGRLLRARTTTADELRVRSAELRRQREQTARLAVLADRSRLSADLEDGLHARIGGIADAAASGLSALDGDPAAAQRALASIERDGRAVLVHLREVLGTLREPAPSEPQPTLARLSELLASATTATSRLTVDGTPRTLPAGLELSGYRIVENLLQALQDAPGVAVDVRLRFRPDALELHVSGPPSLSADLRAVLAAARARAALHGGTVQSWLDGGRCHAMASLPLISGHG